VYTENRRTKPTTKGCEVARKGEALGKVVTNMKITELTWKGSINKADGSSEAVGGVVEFNEPESIEEAIDTFGEASFLALAVRQAKQDAQNAAREAAKRGESVTANKLAKAVKDLIKSGQLSEADIMRLINR